MIELNYERLQECHGSSLMPIWSDEAVIRYTNIREPCSAEEIKDKINVLKNFDVFVVIKENSIIGIIGCPCINEEQGQYGFFYQFCKSSWRQGYATTAAKWLLEFMQQKHPEATLFADVVTDNIASEKILKKHGFVLISEEDFEENGIKTKIHNYKKPPTI